MIIKYIIFFTKDKLFTRLIQFFNRKNHEKNNLGRHFWRPVVLRGESPVSCLSLRDLQLTRGGERFLFLG